jgi:hypothetical protein
LIRKRLTWTQAVELTPRGQARDPSFCERIGMERADEGHCELPDVTRARVLEVEVVHAIVIAMDDGLHEQARRRGLAFVRGRARGPDEAGSNQRSDVTHAVPLQVE